ncbi:hypothetical protein QBC39DRAFT_434533 [Podospora conica]|nr:hypothetical protein QBC39DRAFT_434533 [Schizothecium conicum]
MATNTTTSNPHLASRHDWPIWFTRLHSVADLAEPQAPTRASIRAALPKATAEDVKIELEMAVFEHQAAMAQWVSRTTRVQQIWKKVTVRGTVKELRTQLAPNTVDAYAAAEEGYRATLRESFVKQFSQAPERWHHAWHGAYRLALAHGVHEARRTLTEVLTSEALDHDLEDHTLERLSIVFLALAHSDTMDPARPRLIAATGETHKCPCREGTHPWTPETCKSLHAAAASPPTTKDQQLVARVTEQLERPE